MADKDTRNYDPDTGKGRTTTEIVDDMAGDGPSAPPSPPAPQPEPSKIGRMRQAQSTDRDNSYSY